MSFARAQLIAAALICVSPVLVASAAARPARRPIEAVFGSRSYAPGDVAELTLWSRPPTMQLQVFRAGPATTGAARRGPLTGMPVIGFATTAPGARVR